MRIHIIIYDNPDQIYKSGKNNVAIETIISPLDGEFHFEDGEIYVKIGLMKVEVRGLDVDKDGIIDPVDALEVNNYIMLPILGILHIPLCAFLENVVKKLHKNASKPLVELQASSGICLSSFSSSWLSYHSLSNHKNEKQEKIP